MARPLVPQTRPQSLIDRRFSASPFSLLDREFGRFARELMGGGWPALQEDMGDILRPRTNISETDKDWCVTVDLPGVSPSDLEVTAEGDMLTIRATREEEKREEKENFHVLERQSGTYQRIIQLPMSVDAEKIEAAFDKGVLKLTVPKSTAAERARKVEVRTTEATAAPPTMQAPEATQPAPGAEGQTPTAH